MYQQQFGATPAAPAAPRLVLCACITYGFPQLLLCLLLCLLRYIALDTMKTLIAPSNYTTTPKYRPVLEYK